MAAKNDERSEEEQLLDDDGDASGKRRRVQRACDVCRKKKIRCDGLQPEKGACTNCASYGHECTFADAVKRRAPPRSYVIALEARMEKAEQVITQLAPYIDLDKAIGPMPVLPSEKREGEEEAQSSLHSAAPSEERSGAQSSSRTSSGSQNVKVEIPEDEEDEEDEDAAYLRVSMQSVSLCDEMPAHMVARINKDSQKSGEELFRFDSTGIGFNDASKERPMSTGGPGADPPMSFLGRASNFHIFPLLERLSQNNKRSASLQPAETSEVLAGMDKTSQEEEVDYSKFDFAFPPYDLQQKLISAYFGRHNRDLPILNEVVTRRSLSRPSWEWKDGRTISIALGIFCVASRYMEDPRLTLPDGTPAAAHWHASLTRLLYGDFTRTGTAMMFIQSTLLSIVYASAVPKTAFVHCWVSLSAAVRMLEDCGAHRKFTAKRLGYSLLTEETYKRLWWVTYVLDRQLSADLGRPMAIQDEDFDLDEILLVDDEFLVEASETKTEPIQPSGRICVYEGFLQTTRLSQVIGRTLRTIYAISKSKISRGFVGRKWDALVVADIDRSLNEWLEGVPSYLRYNPNEPDMERLLQSSRIFVQYYFTQTLIHRPFIISEKMNNSDLTFKSLAIVSNASRSAIHIIHNLQQRGLVSYTNVDVPFRVFGFGCMLLFISWSAFANNLRVSQSIMGDVTKCLEIFQALQSRWATARNMATMLQVIIERSEVPVMGSVRHSSKRGHGEESDQSAHQLASSMQSSIAQDATPRDIRQIPSSYMHLPLSTTELQSAFGGSSDSPEFFGPDSASSSSEQQVRPIDAEGAGRAGPSMGDWNRNTGRIVTDHWPAQQAPSLQQEQASLASSSAGPFSSNNNIDPTIFDPTNRTLDAFLSGRMTQSAFEMFASTPGGGYTFAGGAGDGSTEPGTDGPGRFEAQTMPGSTHGDPLDALVNMQSFWSDSDWMRALEHQA